VKNPKTNVSKAVVATLLIGIGAAPLVRAQQKVTGGSLSAADYIEIQQLVARYSYAVDTHADNGYAYADLFTTDGTFGKHQRSRGAGGAGAHDAERQRRTCVYASLSDERHHLPDA